MADSMAQDGALVREWCEFHRTNRRVMSWLEKNPPPADFRVTPLEFAYWWMPYSALYGPTLPLVMGQPHPHAWAFKKHAERITRGTYHAAEAWRRLENEGN